MFQCGKDSGQLREKRVETHKHGFCSCVSILASTGPWSRVQEQADVGQSILNEWGESVVVGFTDGGRHVIGEEITASHGNSKEGLMTSLQELAKGRAADSVEETFDLGVRMGVGSEE